MHRQAARGILVTLIVVGGCISESAAPGGAAPADIVRAGTIGSVNGDGITLTSEGSGVTSVRISPATRVLGRHPVGLDAIKPGDYLAVTSERKADGTLVAVSINIFPPELKGRVREGQFPMDTGNIMTNAEVMEYAVRIENQTLFLKYRDGASAITVPPATPVHRLTVIHLGDLRPGMHVVVRGIVNPDGSITASSLTADQPG
jgi:hypothetical protein